MLPKFFERIALSLIYSEQPEQIAHGRSFVLSDLRDSLTVAHFLWATWVIAHYRSFVLSNLSKSITVAHLIWAKWANEQIPSPDCTHVQCTLSRTLQCFLGYCKELWNVFLGIVLHRTLQCVLRYLLYRILQCFLSYCTIKSNGMFSYVLYCTEHCYAFLGIVLSVQNIAVFS